MPHLEVIVIYGDTKKLQLFVEFEGSPPWTKKLYYLTWPCLVVCIFVLGCLVV